MKEKSTKFVNHQGQDQNHNAKHSFKKFEKPKAKTKSDQKCRDFNYKGVCTFNPCRFIHSCDVTGCNENHAAINHVKNQ